MLPSPLHVITLETAAVYEGGPATHNYAEAEALNSGFPCSVMNPLISFIMA